MILVDSPVHIFYKLFFFNYENMEEKKYGSVIVVDPVKWMQWTIDWERECCCNDEYLSEWTDDKQESRVFTPDKYVSVLVVVIENSMSLWLERSRMTI